MNGSIASGLGTAILTIVIVACLIIGAIASFGGRAVYKTDSIESTHRIEPELRLVTDGKKVDTLFIYHKPK